MDIGELLSDIPYRVSYHIDLIWKTKISNARKKGQKLRNKLYYFPTLLQLKNTLYASLKEEGIEITEEDKYKLDSLIEECFIGVREGESG